MPEAFIEEFKVKTLKMFMQPNPIFDTIYGYLLQLSVFIFCSYLII